MLDLNLTDIVLLGIVVIIVLLIIATNVKRGEVMHPAIAAIVTGVLIVIGVIVDEYYLH